MVEKLERPRLHVNLSPDEFGDVLLSVIFARSEVGESNLEVETAAGGDILMAIPAYKNPEMARNGNGEVAYTIAVSTADEGRNILAGLDTYVPSMEGLTQARSDLTRAFENRRNLAGARA